MLTRSFTKMPIDWEHKFRQKQLVVEDPALLAFYEQPLPALSTPMQDVTFLAMDFETTGLNAKEDDIITIGTVPFTLNRIFLNQAKHWTVRPSRPLPDTSIVIHGITHNDIIDAPDLREVYQEVLNQMAGKVVTVHYNPIERQFFDAALQSRIGEGIEFPVIDTMEIENTIQHKQFGGLWNRLKGKRPQSVRLGQSRDRYGLPLYTPHHALVDAIATAELLQAQIAHYYHADQPLKDFLL